MDRNGLAYTFDPGVYYLFRRLSKAILMDLVIVLIREAEAKNRPEGSPPMDFAELCEAIARRLAPVAKNRNERCVRADAWERNLHRFIQKHDGQPAHQSTVDKAREALHRYRVEFK